ncbi:hypothetical protein AX15_002070 [Amanita polypyramis BW_CC]|nr:hypothetical protein AX15_002070 [Amanita polypyramis BW_CC]
MPSPDVPPGLRTGLKLYTSSSGDNEWLLYEREKNYTNAFIVQGRKILLGYKKRGFGKGMFNGFGGKVEPGETSLQAAKRELEEESGIQAPLVHAGELLFVLEGDPVAFHIDVFYADEYTGNITETEEMRPEWFSTDDTVTPEGGEHSPIPFEMMWKDDIYWFPLLFERRFFVGRADFGRSEDEYTMRRWWFGAD